jgi:cysteine-S-conjugate beta-lyase
MTNFDFDTPVDRRNTLSYKWDSVSRNMGEEDVLPMWVADMDFKCPKPMLDALQKRIEHGIFGYTKRGDRYYEIIQSWLARRFDWNVQKEWLCYCPPGVIPAVTILLDILTKPGDPVIMHMPNYDSLFGAVKDMGRRLIECPLQLKDDGYHMDFELFERLILQHSIKVMVFCSPHNPTGRVWNQEELKRLSDLCSRYEVTTISDEVHCDIVYKPHVHTPFGKIPGMEKRSVTLMSPNKSFNVGGLMTASVIIPDLDLMARYRKVLGTWAMNLDTTFGTIAVETLYSDAECEAWLDAVVAYLENNVKYAADFVNRNIKGVSTLCPQGTYLLWLDFTKTGMSGEELNEFLVKKAHLDLSRGTEFDPACSGHMRMNLACPFATVQEAMRRLQLAMADKDASSDGR